MSEVLRAVDRAMCSALMIAAVMTATARRRAASNVYVVYTSRILVDRPLATPRAASTVVMATSAPAAAVRMM